MSGPYPQARIRLARPDVGEEEIEAVSRVLRGSVLTGGPELRAFEAAFADVHRVEHAVAMANGTVALAGLHLACGIGPGDEVIVPSLTFVSSVTSILHVGATPVFADVQADTFNLDPADVARRIGPRTRAVLAVHYGGQPADLAELAALAEDAGLVLLEDAAEAHGATYRGRPVGGWGAGAMFSFTPTKNITTGEGGIVTTDDGDLAARLRLLRNHGQTSLYRHELVGSNWRMTEMQAAMGRCQVARLPAILARKDRIADRLDAGLAGIGGIRAPARRSDRTHVHMLYTTTLDAPGRRADVLDGLRRDGIEARVYFPPVHRQPIFAGHEPDLPVTEDLAGRILSLPAHSRLTDGEVDEVLEAVAALVRRC